MAENEVAAAAPAPAPAPAMPEEDKKPEDATQQVAGEGEAPAEGEGADGEAKPETAVERQDEFIFYDEKKKKKKDKKKKVKPPPKPTRAQYETTLKELNAILAELRRKATKLDAVNYEHNEKLVEAHELDADVSEHLKRVEKKRAEIVTYEEDYQTEIIKKIKELEVQAQVRIKELNTTYKSTEKQLLDEISMLNSKFRSLCSFTDGGDTTLEKMSSLEREYKKRERVFKDRLFQMLQRNVVLRKNTDDEAKARFDRIIDDFTKSREVRNAAYTRRLLNENSTLRKKYNILIPKNLKKELEFQKILQKTQDINEKYEIVSALTNRLEMTQTKRNELIEKLRKSYAYYTEQVVTGSKYRKMFEAIKEHEEKELSKYSDQQVLYEDINEHTMALHEKYRELKEAENQYLFQRQQHELFVDSVKNSTISLVYDDFFPKTFDEYVAKRDGIVSGLIDVLTNTQRPIDSKAMLKAKYFKGYLGFMPLDYDLCRTLQEQCYADTDDLKWVPSFCQNAMKFNLCVDEEEDKGSHYSDPAMLCAKN